MDVTVLHGIGPKKAQTLRDHGLDTVEKLAAARYCVLGQKYIKLAKEFMGANPATATSTASQPGTSDWSSSVDRKIAADRDKYGGDTESLQPGPSASAAHHNGASDGDRGNSNSNSTNTLVQVGASRVSTNLKEKMRPLVPTLPLGDILNGVGAAENNDDDDDDDTTSNHSGPQTEQYNEDENDPVQYAFLKHSWADRTIRLVDYDAYGYLVDFSARVNELILDPNHRVSFLCTADHTQRPLNMTTEEYTQVQEEHRANGTLQAFPRIRFYSPYMIQYFNSMPILKVFIHPDDIARCNLEPLEHALLEFKIMREFDEQTAHS